MGFGPNSRIASGVPVTPPGGTISGTNVQAVIDEIANEFVQLVADDPSEVDLTGGTLTLTSEIARTTDMQLADASIAAFVPTTKYKAADLSKSSDTAIAADPDLTIAVTSGLTYEFEVLLFFNGAATRDIKVQLLIPGTGFIRFFHRGGDTTDPPVEYARGGSSPDPRFHYQASDVMTFGVIDATTANIQFAEIKGFYQPNASGQFAVGWAQNTSGGTSYLKQGSMFKVRRISV